MENKKNLIYFIISIAILLSVLIGCQDKHDNHDGHDHSKHGDSHDDHSDHNDHDDKGEQEGVVKLNKKEQEEFDIQLEKVQAGKLKLEINLSGEVVINDNLLAHVVPKVSGIARKISKNLGDPVFVKEGIGDVMAILDSREIGQERINFLDAISKIEVAKSNVDVAQAKLDITKTKNEIAQKNYEWQKIVHDNTNLLLEKLKKGENIDSISSALQNKPIGNNRGQLLSAYAALNYTNAAKKREQGLRERKISSGDEYLQAKMEYEKSKSEFESLVESISFKNELSLLEKLQDQKVMKQEVFLAQQNVKVMYLNLGIAESVLQNAEQKLHILGLSHKEIMSLKNLKKEHADISHYFIRAPFDGVVIKKHISRGEFLSNEAEAFLIADLSQVWVNLTLYQKHLDVIHTGQIVTIYGKDNKLEAKGKIEYISPLVEESTRTATARVVLENSKGQWKPGMFVTSLVVVKDIEIQHLLPNSAIQMIDGENIVFVQTEKGFKPVFVKVGRSNKTHVEIVSGLKGNETYVSKNAFTLKAEMEKGSFGHGHSH